MPDIRSTEVPADPILVVLAAGMGSRYGGLKQMDGFGPAGETLLEYSVFDAIRAGFGRIVFVVREEFREEFDRVVASRFRPFVDVQLAVQDPTVLPEGFVSPPDRRKPFGTVQALLAASPLLDRPFALVNADDLYGPEALQLAADGLRALSGTGGVLVSYPLASTLSAFGPVTRGVCEVVDSLLTGIEEVAGVESRDGAVVAGERVFGPMTPTSVNLMGFLPEVLPRLDLLFRGFLASADLERDELPVSTALGMLLAKGEFPVRVLPATGGWCGVTVREDKPSVESFVASLIVAGVYPSALWNSA